MLMLQTDIIIRKAITGISGTVIFSLQYLHGGGTEFTVEDGKKGSLRMYAQDDNSGTNDFVTLINDNARVYKGGSWKDRAYWLNPSTRRFLDQESSRDDIGFRCAMIRVGSPSGL